MAIHLHSQAAIDMALTANQFLFERERVSDVRDTSERCACNLALDGPNQTYNEEAFRYFLALEQKRSETSSRPFFLLLIDLKKEAGADDRLHSRVAVKLFSGLWLSLRETDVIGWYREDRVAGAVLTFADAPSTDVVAQISQRVGQVLHKALPDDICRRLQVRIYQLPARVKR
jgi:hypothetical protein